MATVQLKTNRSLAEKMLRKAVANFNKLFAGEDGAPPVSQPSVRVVENKKRAVQEAWAEYLERQRVYLGRAQLDVDQQTEDDQLLDTITDLVDGVLDRADEFMSVAAPKTTEPTATELNDASARNKELLIARAKQDVEAEKQHLDEAVGRMEVELGRLPEPDIPTSAFIRRLEIELQRCIERMHGVRVLYVRWQDTEIESQEVIGQRKGTFTKEMEERINEVNISIQKVKEKLPVGRPGFSSLSSDGSALSSVSGPGKSDIFMKKAEWPKFEGNRRNYTTFRRDWKLCVGQYPDTHQLREIRTKVPAAVEPEIKNCRDMDQVWKILDDEYGRPCDVSKDAIEGLMNMQLSGKTDAQKFLSLHQEFNKVKNDLEEVGKKNDLNNSAMIGMLSSRLPNEASKTRCVTFRALMVRSRPDLSDIDTWIEFMEAEKQIQKDLAKIQEEDQMKFSGSGGRGSTGGGAAKRTCFKCGGEGHISRFCVSTSAVSTSSTGSKKSFSRPERTNLLSKTEVVPCPVCKNQHKFEKDGVTYYKTRLSTCQAWQNLGAEEKARAITGAKGCALCTDWTGAHQRDSCKEKSQGGKLFGNCTVNTGGQPCGKKHHHLLHGTRVEAVNTLTSQRAVVAATSSVQSPVLLQMEFVKTSRETHKKAVMMESVIFWDSGSTCSLITHDHAKVLGLEGRKCVIHVQPAGHTVEQWRTMAYLLVLVDRKGNKHEVTVYGVESITSKLEVVSVKKLASLFGGLNPDDVIRPSGDVEVMIGLDYGGLHPHGGEGDHVRGNLRLMKSHFGTGWLLDGSHPSLENRPLTVSCLATKYSRAEVQRIHYVRTKVPEQSFFEMEELGTVVPARCPSHKDCNKCTPQAQQFTRREQEELAMIKKGMSLDREARVIRVTYPYIKDPTVMPDNRSQVIAMARAQERRLKKLDQLSDYNKELKKFLERGCAREMFEEEMSNWTGPVNYISHHGVPKPGSTTTPLRIVSNSSLDSMQTGLSYNQLLAKGPNALTPLLQVLITWRSYTECLVWDLFKAYNCMVTGLEEAHMRRFVWRWGNEEDEFKTYCFDRVHFGDRPAAVLMEESRNMARIEGQEIDPVLVAKMEKGGYVDDNISGGSKDEIDRMVGNVTVSDGQYVYDGTVAQVFATVGMRPKVMVRSGEENAEYIDTLGGSVLGYRWEPRMDEIRLAFRVNVSKKKFGTRVEPDLTVKECGQLKDRLTLRIVMSIVASVYDPLGLISPITIQLKLLLQKTHQIPGITWDGLLSEEFQHRWRKLFIKLLECGEFVFPRSVRPEGAGELVLVGYCDGADPAYACAVYCVWEMTEEPRTHVTRLLAAKARVNTGKNFSTPKSEMNSLVVLCRLLTAIVEGLVSRPKEIVLVGDSECTIATVESQDTVLKPWFSNRVSEVEEHLRGLRRMSIKIGPIQHTPGPENIADLGTRGSATSTDVSPGSVWQLGPSYLCLARDQWIMSRKFLEVEKEVILHQAAVLRARVVEVRFLNTVRELMKKSSRVRCVQGIVARVIAMSAGSREMGLNEPSAEQLKMAKHVMMMAAMDETAEMLEKEELTGLSPFARQGILMTRGRLGKGMFKVLGVSELPVLSNKSDLARLLMIQAHKEDHKGSKTTLWRSRTQAWIVRGFRLAQKVEQQCQQCVKDKRRIVEQRLGDREEETFVASPPFTYLSLDLMGPMKVKSMVNKRASMKVWPLVIVCKSTGAVHTELMADYGAMAFLVAYESFVAVRGRPIHITSDQGSQLTCASSYITWTRQESPDSWDWTTIERQSSHGGETQWKFVAPGCQWRNGLSESRVKILKATLSHTMVETSLNFVELNLILKQAANICNDRPIGVKSLTEDDFQPVTPNMLLIGRTSTVSNPKVTEEEVEDVRLLPRRLAYCEELLQAWWQQWSHQVFFNLLPFDRYKAAGRHKNLRIGDVCLLRYDGKVKDTFRLCRVVEVMSDKEGVVRTVRVEMRPRDARETLLPYKSKISTVLETGVQRLVLIVPEEEVELPGGPVETAEGVENPGEEMEPLVNLSSEKGDLELSQ